MTGHDAEVCGRATELETKAREFAKWKNAQLRAIDQEIQESCCDHEHSRLVVQSWKSSMVGKGPKTHSIERIAERTVELLEAKYKKEGWKERYAELFPQLQEDFCHMLGKVGR